MTKVIYSDNSTLSDLSAQLNNYHANSKAFTFVAAEDAIYLGSIYPFTSKYIKVSSANVSASTPSISYWDGSQWRASAYTLDETGLSGTPFANSGYFNIQTDKRYVWRPDDTTESGTANITGLGDITLYDMYWLKISYSADIAMTIDYVGDLFCLDADIQAIAPSVMGSTFLDDWESGKTDWEEQRIIATDLVIQELKKYKLNSENLFTNKKELTQATVYKTLEIIFRELGDGYTERVNDYFNQCDRLLKQSFSKDTNLNGREDPSEKGIRTKVMVR